MVSFQCEGCGDVLTKKKLDSHRNQCHAPFSCIDCMVTFRGTEYRSHTSCMTEDQKYQGALYREKPSKASKRKSVSILEPNDHNALVPRQAYVEDVPDVEGPPHVPSPPPAVPKPTDSVFDYMVDEEFQDTPQITYNEAREEMAMKNGASSIFGNSRASSRNGYRNKEEQMDSQDYDDNGYSYGTEPVNPRPYSMDMNPSSATLEFMTPAAKVTKARLDKKDRPTPGHSRTNSGSEKKRKRGETEGQIHELEGDTLMADAPGQSTRSIANTPTVVHSGLTGGLNRMLSEDKEAYPFSRSPEEEQENRQRDRDRTGRRFQKHEDPPSPLKRTRHSKDDSGLGISIKGRAVKALSMVGGALLPGAPQENGKTRRRASSSEHGQSVSRGREGENRERKKHKVHRHNGTSSANVRHEYRSRRRGSDESPETGRRKIKAIEYKKHDDSASESEEDRRRGGNSQMVVFGEQEMLQRRCETFLANIPGTDSDKGYSINKALKRWHKQNDVRSSKTKEEEEKELWRGLRLRKNERGEVVVLFG